MHLHFKWFKIFKDFNFGFDFNAIVMAGIAIVRQTLAKVNSTNVLLMFKMLGKLLLLTYLVKDLPLKLIRKFTVYTHLLGQWKLNLCLVILHEGAHDVVVPGLALLDWRV